MRHNEIQKKLQEGGLADLASRAEQDHEVQMARSDLYKLAKYSIKLHEMLKMIPETRGLEGWQQAKITKAADYISSVYHNLDYEMKFEQQQVAEKKKSSYKDGLSAMLESKKKSSKVKEDAPTMTGRQAALKKQQQAALLRSKTTDSGMVDRMNVVGKGMQDKVDKTQADADSLSRAAGVDPQTVQKDITKSLSGKPKLRDKFRKNTESKEENNILDPLRGAAAELFGEPEVSSIPPEETAILQAMEKYKDDPAGFKDWIWKDQDLRDWLAADGNYMVDMVKRHIKGKPKTESKDELCKECGNPSWRTLDEEKQKGVDGKVCWKGYRRMGTKKKGGKTVDNCVKVG